MPSPTADMLISLLWTTTFWVKLYIEKNYHSLWWLFCNHWITFSNKKYIIKTEDQVYKQKYFIWDKKINTEHWLEAPSTDNFYSCGESGTSDYISSKTWSHTSYRWGREPLLWVATCPAYENSRSQLVEVYLCIYSCVYLYDKLANTMTPNTICATGQANKGNCWQLNKLTIFLRQQFSQFSPSADQSSDIADFVNNYLY